MAADVAEALDAFRVYIEPRDGLGSSPFKLACSFDEPASEAEVASAWPGIELPAELMRAWLTSRQSRLFRRCRLRTVGAGSALSDGCRGAHRYRARSAAGELS
jgi:hypothetical protein